AILIHAEILSGNDVGTDLRIPVEEQRTADRRFDDAGSRIEPHDAVNECGVGAGVLEKVDEQFGIFHVALRIALPTGRTVAVIPDQGAGTELSGRPVAGKFDRTFRGSS